jgi:hypothetical protein
MTNASPIKWTVWNQNGPVRETITHLVDDDNAALGRWSTRRPRTLCGQDIGEDSEWGGNYVGCKRCERKASRLGLDVTFHWSHDPR